MPCFPSVPGFRILRRLGSGSDSHVFAAESECGEAVALKVSESDRPVVRARFRREIEIGSAVRHPYLVRLFRGGRVGRLAFVVMELVPGESLKTRVETRGRMSCGVALAVVRQLAEAVAALHAAGVVHGDIKPANVMIPSPGRAVLVDLGFAHRPGESQTILGTANYVAPELCAVPAQDSLAVDLFALGITLFELLSGRLPYPSGTRSDVMRFHRDERPDRLIDYGGPWPANLVRLVDDLVARDPMRRPTATETVAADHGIANRIA